MNKAEVLKLAKLSRIEISDEEAESLTREFDSILKYVGEVKGVGPASHKATQDAGEYAVKNVMREDGPAHDGGIYTKEILEQAPSSDGKFVKVKKIL